MTAPAIVVVDADGPADLALVRELFLEYASWLGFSLDYQGFAEELAGLPGKYAPSEGRLLLARGEGGAAGVAALRPLAPGIAEMKRLYVRPAFRGRRVGELLVDRLIAEARAIGYRAIRLDTIEDKMAAAMALYRRRGFVDIPAYYPSPIAGTAYMELTLAAAAANGEPI
ncbi:MAG: GNAT family N-acetyltransferase [Alphaproteobacteria bacterium]